MVDQVEHRDRCPGSAQRPKRVLRAAERVLIGDHMTVHRGRAICTVCGREVPLNMTGVVSAHSPGGSGGQVADSALPTAEAREPSDAPPAPAEDILEAANLEDLRRRIAVLPPGAPAPLDRDRALRIVEELQRLRRRDPDTDG